MSVIPTQTTGPRNSSRFCLGEGYARLYIDLLRVTSALCRDDAGRRRRAPGHDTFYPR